jgi:hypothetical protein
MNEGLDSPAVKLVVAALPTLENDGRCLGGLESGKYGLPGTLTHLRKISIIARVANNQKERENELNKPLWSSRDGKLGHGS